MKLVWYDAEKYLLEIKLIEVIEQILEGFHVCADLFEWI
jgi:hypothetical protein